MNVNEITFGIEFEITMPSENAPVVGRYHVGRQIDGLPIGWNAQGDCSISAGPGRIGVEVVSPVLSGADGLRQIQLVCEWMNNLGAEVNSSTGCHVHVGFDRTNKDGLKRLIAMVANHEQGIFATTGSKSRENNRFCKGVRSSAEAKTIYENGLPSYADRYHVLNVANLASNGKPTVEFRAFGGTTNATKSIGYVRLAVGFVQRACTETRGRKFGRAYPASLNNGVSAFRRMAKFLGWTGKTTDTVWGGIEDETVKSIEATTKELLRLAKKYDAATA